MRNLHVIDAAAGGALGRLEKPTSSRSFRRTEPARQERVLLVEPDQARRAHLRDAVREVADIDGDADYLAARAHLLSGPYDWLITNVRLGQYNGLHLVLLAGTLRLPTRALVYADERDLYLAREAQRLGAFCESPDRMDRALFGFLRAALPPQDRRNLAAPDRRAAPRGGRRCTDSSEGARADFVRS